VQKLDQKYLFLTYTNRLLVICISFTAMLFIKSNIFRKKDTIRFSYKIWIYLLQGMSRISQIDVLEYFKNGRHKIIVATSVAEEGLDVTSCNLVIRYENVKNEIVRLQSRGMVTSNFHTSI
jgi:ERCC4-related helicase